MKIFKAIWTFIKWLFYFCLTVEDRNRYSMGEMRGMHCHKSESGKGFLGQSTDFYYTPNTKPVREYLTFKEFWTKHYKSL